MTEPVFSPNPDRYEGVMNYRRCGNSGVLLPALALGLWHNFGGVDTFANAQKMAHYAFDKGITHFDLANNYGPPYGSAEETFGLLMEKSFLPYRDELFVSTKAGHDMWQGPYGNWGSRKHLTASLDQSLRRMKLDYVDLFYSHRYDPETPLEETMQTLVDFVRQGKALYIGLSKYPYEVAERAYRYLQAHDVPCLAFQGKLSLLHQLPVQEGILRQAAEEGAGFIAFSPLAQGLLTERYLKGNIPEDSRMAQNAFLKKEALTGELLEQLHALNDFARDRGQTLAELAISWVLHYKEVSSLIIGASSTTQLADNLAALTYAPLTSEELGYIDRILAPEEEV